MAADLSRYDDVLALLTALPQRVPALQVVVVNGSAVTGGWDDHSDLDVEAWCSGDAVTTYDAVLALAHDELPVDSVWELPDATWPDGRQCFVHLQPDAADLTRPTRLLDLVVLTTPERLTMDTRRHGTPIVLHDPEGLLHLRLSVEPLVRLLRIQHCPARWDFGLRYLRTDLPDGFAERVEAVLPGPDLAVRSRAAFAWQDEVLAQLTSRSAG